VLASDTKQTCEIKVLKDGQAVDALVEGIAIQDHQRHKRLCRAAVIGMSQQRRADEFSAGNRARGEIEANRSHEIRTPVTVVARMAAFDLELALKRCFNSHKMAGEMIDYFFAEADRLLPQMRAALQQGDLVEVGQLAHRLKGTAMYLGAEPARDAAQAVEKFEWQPSEGAEAEEAIRALEQQCEVLKAVLTEYQATIIPMQNSP
jgi:HPt (histidine-containing phosphotransfer) domain-containing protein